MNALVGVLAVLHDHLPGHPTGAHTHRAVAHLVMVHPGHPAILSAVPCSPSPPDPLPCWPPPAPPQALKMKVLPPGAA